MLLQLRTSVEVSVSGVLLEVSRDKTNLNLAPATPVDNKIVNANYKDNRLILLNGDNKCEGTILYQSHI